jgi:hypothetical protein
MNAGWLLIELLGTPDCINDAIVVIYQTLLLSLTPLLFNTPQGAWKVW